MPNTVAFLIIMVLWFLILRPLINWIVRPIEQTDPISALGLYIFLCCISMAALVVVGLRLTAMLGG